MNWTCKPLIVLSCFIAFSLSSSPSLLAAAQNSPASAPKTTEKKESVVKKTRRHRAKVVKRQPPVNLQKTTPANPSAGTSQTATKPGSCAVSLVGATGALSQHISARSAMIMDAVSGEAIYAQAPDSPAQPASTIKVLTGVISLDALRKNELVEVSPRAAMMPKSKVYLNAGKKYPANDLINAVLLASANDASVALAEKIGGSEEVFARLMTAKARSFGATNTVCKTANGLTASGQYTTAHDLAKIFNNAMRNNEFASKMAVTEVENTDGKIIRSHNRALWQVDGAEGGKTGYTEVARKTYVGKFKRDNDEIVVALMGSDNLWGDVKKLVEYGFIKKRELKMAKLPPQKASEASRLFVQLGNNQRRLPVAESF